MSVRRWIGIVGMGVAVAAGTAATIRGNADPEFQAQVSVLLNRSLPTDVRARLLNRPERLFDTPEVNELVRLRLGGIPPLSVTAAPDDTLLLRSRGASRGEAAEATKTYAESYVELQRRKIEAEAAAASMEVHRKVAQVNAQIASAEEPQRASLLELRFLLNTHLDMLQLDLYGPQVVDFSPAEPVDRSIRGSLIVAALGVTACAGAAASARRAGRRSPAANGDTGKDAYQLGS